MEELEKSIEAITISNNGRLPNIILSGDFNLSSIDWETNQAINSKSVEIANNNAFIQMVTEPTRGNNILDLLFTTNPALVEHIEIHPGMSDHNIVITDVNLRARTVRVTKKPRKVHLFKKADMGSLNKDIEQDLTRYLEDENIENKTTEDLWQFFKETITKAVTKHVPQKTIGGKQHIPWINTHIKRLIRRRQRRYNAAKKHKTTKSWALYKAMKDLVKKTMNEAHENYIRNILNIEDNCETSTKQSLGKKFWKYIKSRKKDNMGISPLKNKSGEEVIDSKGKAEILNQQYDRVFTDEDLNTIP